MPTPEVGQKTAVVLLFKLQNLKIIKGFKGQIFGL